MHLQGRPVVVPSCVDLTALGTAQLALLGAGVLKSHEELICGKDVDIIAPQSGTDKAAHAARLRFAQAVDLIKSWGDTCSLEVPNHIE